MAKKTSKARTINHEEMKQWAEERGGRPALIISDGGDNLLAIDFGEKGKDFEAMSWEDFLRIFEENDLAFVYEEVDSDGEVSYAYQFVARGPEDEMAEAHSLEGDEPLM